MNVYTRPLFRQAGGPAQPMAQDMSQEIERVAGQLNYLNTMIAVEPNMSTKRQLMEAIQNLAQTTPPEVFNAASKLVRDAEASKSPDVMANPNMDPGNRSFVSPVNRANGGEIMPPAMQQGMAPPPEAAMLERAEMMASQQAEQLGAQYAQDMMQNVNSAESAEDLINAMRGNQMPLEARREELGGLVGMEDANATPESVLALVQPVIMMTEEGAINSGIGELMQGIIGDVEMTTEGGMPTEMGQGVGGLMMAGAQEAPAPQNFNQGGAVQSYALGGIAMPPAFAPMLDSGQDTDLLQPIEVTATRREPMTTDQGESASEMLLSGSVFGDSVKGYYNEMLPLYQEILGQTEDQKNYNKAQAYFDLAQAGLALASGTDPRTGKSVAGQPFGAQLATAASALPAAFQERAAEQRKLEQGVKSSALSGAMQQALSEQDYKQKLNLAVLDASLKGTTTVDDVIVRMPDGSPKVFDIKKQLPEYRAAIESGGVVTEGKKESSYGSSARGQALERLSTPEGVQGAILGLLGERTPEAMLGLSDLAEIQEFSEQTGEATSVVPTHLQPFVRLINDPVALKTFQENNAETKQMFMDDMEATATAIANGTKDPSELYDFVDARIATAANIDMESGTGLPSGFWSLVEGGAQQFSDIFNLNLGDGVSDSDQARRMLSSVMQSVDRYVAGAPDESRLLQQQYERLVEQLPKASMIETDASAKEGLKNYRDLVDSDISVLQNTIEQAQLYRPATLDRTRRRLMQAYNLRSLLTALYENYAGGVSGANIPTDVGTFLEGSSSLKTPSFDMSIYYRNNEGG